MHKYIPFQLHKLMISVISVINICLHRDRKYSDLYMYVWSYYTGDPS